MPLTDNLLLTIKEYITIVTTKDESTSIKTTLTNCIEKFYLSSSNGILKTNCKNNEQSP